MAPTTPDPNATPASTPSPGDASEQVQLDAQILRQLETEEGANRSWNQSPGALLSFALSLAACVGVFAVLLQRVHPRAPASVPATTRSSEPQIVPAPQVVPAPAFIGWTYDFESGQSRARASGKKMLVAFGAGWCSSCRWMESSVYPRPEVGAEAGNVEMVKVDSDARPDLARRTNIRVLPSLVWMTSEGVETARNDGSLPAPLLAQMMRANR